MGSKKVHVFLVQAADSSLNEDAPKRLIRGTLKDAEAKLRAEVSIEPCTAEQAHAMSDVEIEEASE